MSDSTGSYRGSLGLIVLGVPGVALFLGGLWIWFVMAYGFADGMIRWESLSAAPRERLMALLIVAPISPPVGYAMIVLAANMMGIQRYRLLPKHAGLQALLDASHLALVALILCLLISTLTPSGYPTLHIPTYITCAALTPIAWIHRRFAQTKQNEWQEISSEAPTT